jgi:hypothetical protein
LTDRDWALIEPYMPACKPLGRSRTVPLQEVVDALF